MAARTKVFVDITTKTESANKGLAKYAVGVGIATVAVAGLIKIGKELEAVYKVQEQAEARLEQTIKATGKAANLTKKELTDMASGLQKVTQFGDEAIIGAESLLLTFKNIGEDTFPRALESILDVSEAMGTGLKESSIQVGKALNDPVQGLTALRRVGIQFTDSQEATIKSMVAMNDITSAQNIILTELESQFGGVARAAADTATGVGEQLNNSFGDLKETLGGVISEGLVPYRTELMREIESVNNSIKAHFLRKKAISGEATAIEELMLREIEQGKTEDSLSQAKENLTIAEASLESIRGKSDANSEMRRRGLTQGVQMAMNNIIALEDELTLRKLGTSTAQDQYDAEQDLLDVKLAAFSAVKDGNEAKEEENNLTKESIELLDGQLTLEDTLAQAQQETFDILVGRAENRARLLEEEGKAVEKLKIDYEKLAVGAMGSFATAFEQIGSDGVSAWDVVKQSGKDAMSSVLKGLAQESLARAALALVPGPTFNPVAVAGYTAAAAAAYAASGLVQSFATGGSFTANEPTMIQVGEQGQEEVTIKPTSGNSGGGMPDRIWIQVEDSVGFWGMIQHGVDNRLVTSYTGEQI